MYSYSWIHDILVFFPPLVVSDAGLDDLLRYLAFAAVNRARSDGLGVTTIKFVDCLSGMKGVPSSDAPFCSRLLLRPRSGHQVVAAEVHVSDQSCDTPPGSALSSFHEGLHGEHPAPGFHRSHSPLNMPRGSIVSMPEGNVVTRRRRPHRPKRRATPPGRRHYSSSSSQQHYGFFPPTDTVSVDDFLLRQGDSDEEGDYATVEDDDFSRRRNNGRTS
ncbi:unnamed protein product, partial [Cyprideis torosa]